MRTQIFAAATAAALTFGAAAADAMPATVVVSPAVAPQVTLVAGGCGLGFHRGPYGGCLRNGVVVRRVGPVFGRVCVTRRFGFGVRRVCR